MNSVVVSGVISFNEGRSVCLYEKYLLRHIYKLHEVQKYKLGKILLFLFFYRVEGVRFGGG